MNCREGQKAPRGTGEAKRVFTQSQRVSQCQTSVIDH